MDSESFPRGKLQKFDQSTTILHSDNHQHDKLFNNDTDNNNSQKKRKNTDKTKDGNKRSLSTNSKSSSKKSSKSTNQSNTIEPTDPHAIIRKAEELTAKVSILNNSIEVEIDYTTYQDTIYLVWYIMGKKDNIPM